MFQWHRNISTPNILDELKGKTKDVTWQLLFHFYKLSKDFNFNPSFLNQELTKEQAWYHYFEKIILKKQLILGLHKRDSSTAQHYYLPSL